MESKSQVTPCPCGSGSRYETCCARFIDEGQIAPTAEALMRSRYTAYTRRDTPYLLATWHSATRPARLGLDEQPAPKWISLQIVRHTTQDADNASVEFIAHYKLNGRAFRLHETSRFAFLGGRWLYVDGEIHE